MDNKKHVFVEKTCKEVSNFLTEMRESLINKGIPASVDHLSDCELTANRSQISRHQKLLQAIIYKAFRRFDGLKKTEDF